MALPTAQIPITLDPVMSLMMAKQREFQVRLFGKEPHLLTDAEKMAYIREQALALEDELHEALQETGWKPWASSNHINRDAYRDELSEVFIFLMNLLLVADITAAELCKAVLEKQFKNNKRQDEGYDGVSTKCPVCRRAYDDKAVACYPATDEEPAYCAQTEGML